jgi:hypothetical protein
LLSNGPIIALECTDVSDVLKIRMKKNPDGGRSLACTRADGTVTWQSRQSQQAAFFPRHDLTHFAVETVLAQRNGFYGLLAAGWDLSDFGVPWPRGRIPPEADVSETIVGFLDIERASGERAAADQLNELLAARCAEKGYAAPPRITDESLREIRRKRAELFAQWDAVRPGESLELVYD